MNKIKTRYSVMIILFVLPIMIGFGEKVIAQAFEPKSMNAVRTLQPPKINGRLDDSCWQEAPKATGFVDMLFDTVVEDQTIAYLLYDDMNIYAAFYCFDSQPDKIIARETKRDGSYWNDDFIAFGIDPFHAHKHEDRSFFVVNPIGTQFSNIAGGRASKTEWKGDWKASAVRTPDGWTVEMAIPFAILNYPSTDKPVIIGINFDRRHQRTGIHSYWSNVGPQEFIDRDGNLIGVVFPKKTFKQHFSAMT